MIAEVHAIPFTPIIGHTISLFSRSKSRLESLDMIFYEADGNVNMVKVPLYINNKYITDIEVPEQIDSVKVFVKLSADIGMSEESFTKKVVKYIKIKSAQIIDGKAIDIVANDQENKYDLVFEIRDVGALAYVTRKTGERAVIKVISFNIQLVLEEIKNYSDGKLSFIRTALNYIVQALSTIYTEFIRFIKSIISLVKSIFSKVRNKFKGRGEPIVQPEVAFINILTEKFRYEAIYFEAEGNTQEGATRRLMAKILEFIKSIFTNTKKGLISFWNWLIRNIKAILALLIKGAYIVARKTAITLRKLYMKFNSAANTAEQVNNVVQLKVLSSGQQTQTQQDSDDYQELPGSYHLGLQAGSDDEDSKFKKIMQYHEPNMGVTDTNEQPTKQPKKATKKSKKKKRPKQESFIDLFDDFEYYEFG